MKKRVSTLLLILSLLFFISGTYCIYEGFDKKDHYSQGEFSWSKNVNAYVGGDAYNYIINSTYFAGYCALGGAMFVCGSISGVGGIMCWLRRSNSSRTDIQGASTQLQVDIDNGISAV